MNERTCLVTGRKSPDKGDFFRFTVQDGALIFDKDKTNPGRGGYVIRDQSAIGKLPKLEKKLCHFLKVKKIEIKSKEIERMLDHC